MKNCPVHPIPCCEASVVHKPIPSPQPRHPLTQPHSRSLPKETRTTSPAASKSSPETSTLPRRTNSQTHKPAPANPFLPSIQTRQALQLHPRPRLRWRPPCTTSHNLAPPPHPSPPPPRTLQPHHPPSESHLPRTVKRKREKKKEKPAQRSAPHCRAKDLPTRRACGLGSKCGRFQASYSRRPVSASRKLSLGGGFPLERGIKVRGKSGSEVAWRWVRELQRRQKGAAWVMGFEGWSYAIVQCGLCTDGIVKKDRKESI